MILSTLIVFVIALTSPSFLYSQDAPAPPQPLTVDEETLDSIFSIDSVNEYSFEDKKELFDSVQIQIKNAYALKPINLNLIKSLVDKQQRLFPDERKSYIDLAVYFDKINNEEKIFKNSNKALEKDNIIHQDNQNRLIATAYTYIGRYYLENQKYEQAYEALSKALVEKTALAAPFYYMGNTCFHLKDYRECQNNYTYAFSRNIKIAYPIDYFFFSIALHKNGFTDKAREMLKIGCEQYPNEQGMHLNLGYIYREQDKLIEAYLEFYTEQLLFGPDSEFFKTAEINKKTTEKLIALRKDTRETNTLINIIQWETAFNKNNYKKAEEGITSALKNFDEYNFALSFLQYLTYFYMGNYEKALKTIEHIEEKTLNAAITYISIYETCSKLGDTKKANENLEQALRLDPNNWKTQQVLGIQKNQEGKSEKTKDNDGNK